MIAVPRSISFFAPHALVPTHDAPSGTHWLELGQQLQPVEHGQSLPSSLTTWPQPTARAVPEKKINTAMERFMAFLETRGRSLMDEPSLRTRTWPRRSRPGAAPPPGRGARPARSARE